VQKLAVKPPSKKVDTYMFNLTHNSKKKWLASFALITSVAAVAATINFSDDFSTEDSIDTVKTTANLSTEEQAVYLAW
jgi:hypothetical protein